MIYVSLVTHFIFVSDTLGTGRQNTPGWDASLSPGTIYTHIHTNWQFNVASRPNCMFLDSGKKLDNPKKTHITMRRACESPHRQ